MRKQANNLCERISTLERLKISQNPSVIKAQLSENSKRVVKVLGVGSGQKATDGPSH